MGARGTPGLAPRRPAANAPSWGGSHAHTGARGGPDLRSRAKKNVHNINRAAPDTNCFLSGPHGPVSTPQGGAENVLAVSERSGGGLGIYWCFFFLMVSELPPRNVPPRNLPPRNAPPRNTSPARRHKNEKQKNDTSPSRLIARRRWFLGGGRNAVMTPSREREEPPPTANVTRTCKQQTESAAHRI